MENNRGQSIFLSVVGIATLLVAIVGATFAYFSISVTGNTTASSINVTTALLGGVTYSGNTAGINVTDVYPGWTETKTFTISTDATGVDATANINYIVNLHTNTTAANSNDDTKNLAAAAASKHDFTYTVGTPTTTAGTATPAVNSTNADMPTTDGIVELGTGTLVGPNCVHTWSFTVLLKESSTDQNELQGKSYHGVIQVVVATTDGLRTWDNANSRWTKYPLGS